jgi:APA family basic amino acid/polyamine antiporter
MEGSDAPVAPIVHVLRRSIGTPTAVATSAGLAFAAIDFLGVVSVSTYALGASAWIAIFVGGLFVLLVAGIFSELNGLFPTAAGIRLYIGRAIGPRTSLAVGFTYMSTVVLVIAADAFLIGAAIGHVLHEPSWLSYVWIFVLLGVAAGANLRGIRLAGWLQSIVTYTVLASTSVLSVIAIFHVGGSFEKPFALFGHGTFSAVQAIAFSLFLYAAFEWVTTTAEEARRPQVITKALFIAPALIWGAATLFSLGLSHLVPIGQSHGSAYPQLLLGTATLGTVGELWMFAVTLLTALNTFNGGFLVASRFIYATARDGGLPRSFAKLNLQAVPWLAVVTLAGASALIAAVVFATHQWLLLVAVGATIEAAIYARGVVVRLGVAPEGPARTALPPRGGQAPRHVRTGPVRLARAGLGILGPEGRAQALAAARRRHRRHCHGLDRLRHVRCAQTAGAGSGQGRCLATKETAEPSGRRGSGGIGANRRMSRAR